MMKRVPPIGISAVLPTVNLWHSGEKRSRGHDLRPLAATGRVAGWWREKWSRLSLAGVHVHQLVAVLASHGAAPVELALALGGAAHSQRVVAAAAAHDLTAVSGTGRPVADPTPGTQGPCRESERERERGKDSISVVRLFHKGNPTTDYLFKK